MSYDYDDFGPEELDAMDDAYDCICEQRIDNGECVRCGRPLDDDMLEQELDECGKSDCKATGLPNPASFHPNAMFADPGGNSALRAETPDNPRNLPCPNCGEPNRLTPADRARGYQCDSCADALERGGF